MIENGIGIGVKDKVIRDRDRVRNQKTKSDSG